MAVLAEEPERLRLDKWFWHARFYKTRGLAADACKAGRVRLNGTHVKKASQMVGPGDILTFPKGPHVRVVEIVACGVRRGPAPEAQALYKDLAPIEPKSDGPEKAIKAKVASREPGSGRPTKAERRATDRLIGRD